MEVIPALLQQEIIVLFKQDKTAREIAERTGFTKEDILFFLTKESHWSKYCSSCVLKRCYDCQGLQELGKPVSIQDRINFMANNKNA